jgi:serine/threonine protein kinase
MEEVDRRVQYDLRRAVRLAYGEQQGSGDGPDHDPVPAPDSDTVPSPFYAAPELFEGGRFDIPTDLWSLGVLTYEVCTGIV